MKFGTVARTVDSFTLLNTRQSNGKGIDKLNLVDIDQEFEFLRKSIEQEK